MGDYSDKGASDYVAESYRYLRLSIIVVALTLGVSVLIERYIDDCQLGSISAYYYTPVHAVFIGALITIGVVMIALKGSDALEDMLFNIAGVLAPFVALVPTDRPKDLCRDGQVSVEANDLISNNVPSLLIGFVLALGIAFAIARRQDKIRDVRVSRATVTALVISVALLLVGIVWYVFFEDSFLRYAHGSTAVAMFVFVWFAVVVDAGWPRRALEKVYFLLGEHVPTSLTDPTPRQLRYRTWYRVLSIYMPVAAGAVLLLIRTDMVFWLELAMIAGFVVFWALQTFEGWETGTTHTAPAT